MRLSLVIPTRDRGPIFDKTLQAAVVATQGLDVEILVVNDSTIGTPTIPAGFTNVRLLRSNGKGVATARNYGAREATGTLLLFLDDDILIDATGIRHLLQLHGEHSDIAVNPDWIYPPDLLEALDHSAFGRFLLFHNMTSFEGWYADKSWQPDALFESKSVASFHLSVSKKGFERTGGYNERFPFAGFEDYDFPLRLKSAGISFRIDTRIKVFHNEADRLSLENWMLSQERRAFTRAIAVRNGYQHLALTYSPLKRVLYAFVLVGFPIWARVLSSWPAGNGLQSIAFAWIGYLQGAKIYQGYSRGLKS